MIFNRPSTPKSNETTTSAGTVDQELRVLPLRSIVRDRALMMRAQLDESAIEDYAVEYARTRESPSLVSLPPPDVFEVEGRLLLVDGWHRTNAMVNAKLEQATFRVRSGSREDAAAFAARANRDQRGVRLTNRDKRIAVEKLWHIFPTVSARVIAEHAGVDMKTAEKYRPEGLTDGPRLGACTA